jgi:hypothetical protein|tara:strand:- start:26 stop:196 length:171 start_codon:yes stop_codon:yes gene_type:complete
MEIPMFLKTALLDAEERIFLRQALFCLQKRMYERQGKLNDHQVALIEKLADKLHLR